MNDPAVRDYLLDYFVDKIFVYDDTVILTAWYGDDKKEIMWGDLDVVVQKERKRKKSSSASELVPPGTAEIILIMFRGTQGEPTHFLA